MTDFLNPEWFWLQQELYKLGESHPHVAARIKKNAMIVRENSGNLARLIIRENFSDLGNLVATVGNSLV
jgi:hypothetical protein